jgi:magnesium transporter
MTLPAAMIDSERLPHLLDQIHFLLDRQRVEQDLVQQQQGPRHEVVVDLTHRQQQAKLQQKLKGVHPADIAHVMESLPCAQRLQVWEQVRAERGGAVLVELSAAVRRQVVAATDEAALRQLLTQLDADDLAELDEVLPTHLLEAGLATLSAGERDWLAASRRYAEDRVGALMDGELVTLRDFHSLGEARSLLRARKELPHQTDKLFVLDRRGQLVGVLTLEALLLAPPETLVRERMGGAVERFRPEEAAAEAVKAFERYDLISAAVVNERGKLVGRLTVEAVMDYSRRRAAHDSLKPAGLEADEDLFAPVLSSARNRWFWISLSLATAIVASRVIGLFEATISHIVALAALMPIITALGGNAGNQTSTLIIRSLALDQINPGNLGHVLRKELILGLLSGLVWGLTVGVFAILVYRDLHLALVLAVSMLLTLIISASFGLAIPLSLRAMNKDPALGASVLITALVDSLGFFIFLGLATLFLM